MTATVVAVSVDYAPPPPRQGFASPVLAMLTPLGSVARGSARPLTRRQCASLAMIVSVALNENKGNVLRY